MAAKCGRAILYGGSILLPPMRHPATMLRIDPMLSESSTTLSPRPRPATHTPALAVRPIPLSHRTFPYLTLYDIHPMSLVLSSRTLLSIIVYEHNKVVEKLH